MLYNSTDYIHVTIRRTVNVLLGEPFLLNIFIHVFFNCILYNSKYKPMNPQTDHLHLVEHFDFYCNAIKELPKGIQAAIDNFYPSFDLVSAAIRQKVCSTSVIYSLLLLNYIVR